MRQLAKAQANLAALRNRLDKILGYPGGHRVTADDIYYGTWLRKAVEDDLKKLAVQLRRQATADASKKRRGTRDKRSPTQV
jgi:hypothetical protein